MATQSELSAVRAVLMKEWPEGTSDEVVAKAAISALDAVRLKAIKPVAPPLRVGLAFTSQLTSKNQFVAWIGDGMAWIVAEDSNFGWLGPVDSPFWSWAGKVNSKQNIIDRVLTNEVGMVAGDKITLRQDGQYLVEAVFKRGVLMRSRQTGQIWAEENANIKKYYRDGWS